MLRFSVTPIKIRYATDMGEFNFGNTHRYIAKQRLLTESGFIKKLVTEPFLPLAVVNLSSQFTGDKVGRNV